MAPKVLFIIVPGSFCTPPAYDKLVSVLRSRDQDVQVVALPSANDGSALPAPTIDDDVAAIRNAVTVALDDAEDPRDVVLALHSYSGVPGTSALEGLGRDARSAGGKPTAAVGIVYFGAMVPDVGQSLRDISISFDALQEPYKTGEPGGYMPAVPAEYAPLIFNDVADQDEVARLYGFFTLHSSDTYSGKATYTAWRDIPAVQIIPEKDMILPTFVPEALYERTVAAGGKVRRVFVEGAGHSINVSRPELVADEMIRQAEEGRK